MSAPGDRARVSVFVAVAPADAFEVFTAEIDRWWLRGPRYRADGRPHGVLCFEPFVGGRLFEIFEGEPGSPVLEAGRVTAWEPPSRLVFDWRGRALAPDERTEVEVCFVPKNEGTMVTLEHRGFASLRPDHPVRHGLDAAGTSRMIGLFWGELLGSLRELVASRR